MPNTLAFFIALFFCQTVTAAITFEESQRHSLIIGKWLTRSIAHQDFLSATPTGPRRAGEKFFVSSPPIQTASDYGASYMQNPRTDGVTRAYEALGVSTLNMPKNLNFNRFHVAWSFGNAHDFTYSLISSQKTAGWGAGYKYVFWQHGPFYASYRLQYSEAARENFFSSAALTNELLASAYLRLIDFYVGVRHTMGRVNFNSDIPELQLPTAQFISTPDEMEFLFGTVIATTTNTRFTLQITASSSDIAVAGKLSLRFDSLFPTWNNWFRDPRALKQ